MKNSTKNLMILFVIGLLLMSCGSSQDVYNAKSSMIEVNKSFEKVYKDTQQALLEVDSTVLEIESIDLTFATTTTWESTAGVKLWVLSSSYKRTKSNSKTATFSFGKKDVKKEESLLGKKEPFKEYLISVIKAAKDIKSTDKFELKEIEIEVEFTLTEAIDGTGEIELLPVTPSISINREKEAVHTITLKFKKPESAKLNPTK